jgi:hypothetical protein
VTVERSLESKQAIEASSTRHGLRSLCSDMKTSSTIISSLPSRLEQTDQKSLQTHRLVKEIGSDLASRITELSSAVNKILSSDFSAFMTTISQNHNQLYEVPHSVQKTRAAIENIGETSEGLRGLPLRMLQMVKDTFRGSLAEFQIETTQLRASHEMADGRSAIHSEKHVPISTGPTRQSSRKGLSHYTNSRRYIRAIGIVTIHSITTTFRDHDTDNGTSSTSTITQTHVELFPNPEFIYMGVYCSFVQQGFATFPEKIEPNLRIYNVVDSSAPIIRACSNGDLQTFQSLFANGEASPFDRMWRDTSLLDLVMFRIVLCATGGIPKTLLPKLMTLFKELVGLGLDPGSVKKIDYFSTNGPVPLVLLWKLLLMSHEHSEDVQRHLIELGRIIINKSVQDPLLYSDNTYSMTQSTSIPPVVPEILSILLTQENWPIYIEPASIDSIVSCIATGEHLHSYIAYEGSRIFTVCLCVHGEDPDNEMLLSTLETLSLYEKIQIMGHIDLRPVTNFGGLIRLSPEEPEEENTDHIVDRLFLCMESCIKSGMDPHEPPFQVYKIAQKFLVNNKRDLLWSVLLDVGLEEDEIDDFFEADKYASLVFQLEYLDINFKSSCKVLQYANFRDDAWSLYLKRLNRRPPKLPINTLLIDGQSVGEALQVMEDTIIGSMNHQYEDADYNQSRNVEASDQYGDGAEAVRMSREPLAEDPDISPSYGSQDLEFDSEPSRPLDFNPNMHGKILTTPKTETADSEQGDEVVEECIRQFKDGAAMVSLSHSMRVATSDVIASQLEFPKAIDTTEDMSGVCQEKATETSESINNFEDFYNPDDGRIEGIAAALSVFWT